MRKKNISIQALRGLAFISIFTYHAGIIPSGGSLGVSIFFVLSGFLLMVREEDTDMMCGIKPNIKYSWSKIRKLYPLHIAMSAVALPLLLHTWIGKENAFLNIVARIGINVALIQSWFPWDSFRYSMNNLSWFLSCMVFLYFMFPWFHNIILKQERTDRKVFICVGIWISMWILGYIVNFLCVKNDYAPSFCQGLTYNNPIYRQGDFFIGCVAGAVYKTTEACISKRTYTILETVCLLLSTAYIIIPWNDIVMAATKRRFWESVPLLIPLSICVIWLFSRCGGGITQYLSNTILVKIGDMSGDAFLIHEVPIIYMTLAIRRFGISGTMITIIKTSIGLIATIIAVKVWRELVARYKASN